MIKIIINYLKGRRETLAVGFITSSKVILAITKVYSSHNLIQSCYIMPAARAYLQISLGKTRSAPTCMHELMTSHVTVKDHVTP